jgi:hypothetical protein
MFKDPSSFKPIVGPLFFGPLLARFLVCANVSKPKPVFNFFWPIVGFIFWHLRYSLQTQANTKKKKKKKKGFMMIIHAENKLKEVSPISLWGNVRE